MALQIIGIVRKLCLRLRSDNTPKLSKFFFKLKRRYGELASPDFLSTTEQVEAALKLLSAILSETFKFLSGIFVCYELPPTDQGITPPTVAAPTITTL
jgi:hypothetical protein